ncbi:MAG TPA: PilZ domain-containing protein [Anaeromyxobacteraceae bacterium]|nr:PilZ domain-containing protein [Anaeromyxobacteraceae bacterium]
MVVFDTRLEPAEWLGAWRADSKRVTLKAPPTTRMKDRVAVRVELVKPSVRATLLGTVVSLQKHQHYNTVLIAVEPDSLDAAKMLHAAAQGEPRVFHPRQPRYLVKLPVLASTGAAPFYASTVAIGMGGCSLRWSGSPPAVGEAVLLSFRGTRSVEMQGVVRWRKPASQTVGLSFVERVRGSEAWPALVDEVRNSGAPPA